MQTARRTVSIPEYLSQFYVYNVLYLDFVFVILSQEWVMNDALVNAIIFEANCLKVHLCWLPAMSKVKA